MSCDVSVVIPVYESSGTLRRALDSVYSQSMLPREIVVVDDGSDDWEKSKIIVESYPKRINICFIHSEKNEGASVARNIGVRASSCRYIAFLDSDDAWFRNKIEIQYGIMVRSGIDFSTHGYVAELSCSKNEEDRIETVKPPCSALSSWSFLFRNYATPTVMILRDKMVPFDSSLRRNEDWKCWMEAFWRYDLKSVFIGCVLAGGFKPAIGAAGLSQDIKELHVSRMIALRKLMNGGQITIVQYLAGACMEAAKYPIRILRIALRNEE